MTAYKYVERKVEDQINWAEVGKNFSNVLQEEVRVRQEKKAAIDEASRQYQEVLNNVPKGEFGLANTFALDAADKLQKQALMQLTLLKSGQLDPRRYTIMQQNLVDGTDQIFSLSQQYQDEFQRKKELMADGVPYGEKLSGLEGELMASMEGLGNLANHEASINPDTGQMGIAVTDDEGKVINNTTSFALQRRLASNTLEFDFIGGADKWIQTLGSNKVAEFKNLGNKLTADVLVTIDDVTQKIAPAGSLSELSDDQLAQVAATTGVDIQDLKTLSLYREAQMNYVKSQLSPEAGGSNAASVLFDHVGGYDTYIIGDGDKTQEKYDALSDEEKAKVILVTTDNGNPEFKLTDDQLAIAERAFEKQIDIGLDYTEEEAAVFRQKEGKKDGYAPEYIANRGDKKKQEKSAVTQWMNVFRETDKAQRENLLDAILKDPATEAKGITDMKFITDSNGDTRLEVTYLDERKNKTGDNGIFLSKKGAEPTQEDWALAGVAIHGVTDPNDIEAAAGGYQPMPDDWSYVDPTGTGVGLDKVASPQEEANAYIGRKVVNDYMANKTEEKFAQQFAADFGALGFTVTIPNSGYESVIITAPNGATEQFYTNYEVGSKWSDAGTLRDWIISNGTEDAAKNFKQSGKGNTGGGMSNF